MSRAALAIIAFCVIIHIAASSYGSGAVKVNKRETSGLMPFPRVGRGASSTFFWKSNPFNGYALSSGHKRREGLMAFPRVGRSQGFLLTDASSNGYGIENQPKFSGSIRYYRTGEENPHIFTRERTVENTDNGENEQNPSK